LGVARFGKGCVEPKPRGYAFWMAAGVVVGCAAAGRLRTRGAGVGGADEVQAEGTAAVARGMAKAGGVRSGSLPKMRRTA
jgi:hypothetical protein